MPDPRLQSVLVTACSMEIPLEDFCHLPQELGCLLERTDERLTLISEQPGCALHFKVHGLKARLASVDVGPDPDGRFFRDVLGLVLQLYSGDLEAKLTWSPRGPMGAVEECMHVRGGESTHPLLIQGEANQGEAMQGESLAAHPGWNEVALERAEQWLAQAQQAWAEYRSLKDLKARSEA